MAPTKWPAHMTRALHMRPARPVPALQPALASGEWRTLCSCGGWTDGGWQIWRLMLRAAA